VNPPSGCRARLALALIALATLSACGGASGADDPPGRAAGAGAASGAGLELPEAPAEPALPVTVTSADGRPVTIRDTSRIAPLQGSIAEVVFALGLGDRVMGRDISATFDEAADLPLVTRAHDVSAESVLSLRPTVVLADDETGPPEALDQIRNVGVPVLIVERPTSIGDIGPRIRTVAEALGVPDAGEELAARTDAEIESVRAAGGAEEDRPLVAFLYLRGQAGVYLMGGPGAGTDAMIEAAGGRDAGTELGLGKAFTPLTSEALVTAAPDVLLLTTTGLESVGGIDGLLEISGVAQTPAGAARRVATVEDGLLFGFGTRTPEALRHLAAQLGDVEAR
jgi:iron complex transport system substrate-binding protein